MKKLVIVLVVVFIGFWLVQAPSSLAAFTEDSVSWAWDMLTTIFGSTIDFLANLTG